MSDFNKLNNLADAYEDAQENDFCSHGECEGLRTDEIALRIIKEIRNIEQKGGAE